MRVEHTRQMFRITLTSLLYCVHFKGAQLMWNATHSASVLPEGLLLLIKVPSALKAEQHHGS